MDWARKSLAELESGVTEDRVAWADIAKALSIILLVYWSLYGTSVYFNQMLIPARMPLFFFVSGLFARGVIIRSEMAPFFRDKIGNLIYLYVLWTLLWFASTELVAHLWWGRKMAPDELPNMIWDPGLLAMWFFYGLAIAFAIAYICREAPVGLVFAGAMLAYCVVVWQGDWLAIPFLEKVIRLFPYFWAGLVLRPWVSRMVARHWRLWPVPAVLYLALAYWMMDSPWQQFGPLTFAATCVALAAFLGFAAHCARFQWAWLLSLIGGSTLYIYATNHITIFYLDRFMAGIGFARHPDWTFVPVVVLVGVAVGRFCARRPALRWLFAAPWVPYKAPVKVTPPPAGGLPGARREA